MIPVVIVAGPRALTTAAAASHYYADGGIAATVVRPHNCKSHDLIFAPGTRFIDDEDLPGVLQVGEFLRSQRSSLDGLGRAPGWFLQQYIKISAVVTLDETFTFIADGDTIFSLNLLRSILQAPCVLTTGEKYENYDRLIDALGIKSAPRSCVANGNIFSPVALLQRLADPDEFQNIMTKYVFSSRGYLDFSEYQIAGSLLEPELGSRSIRMFRRFDLISDASVFLPRKVLATALRRYDAIAIEAAHHRSPLKRVAAQIFYHIGHSW